MVRAHASLSCSPRFQNFHLHDIKLSIKLHHGLQANVLLACGASPAMVHSTDEVEEFVTLASALLVMIGLISNEEQSFEGLRTFAGVSITALPPN